MTQVPIIQVSELVRTFRSGGDRRKVLSGVNLSVNQGEMVCVIGRSGAGKTTLLHILAGLDLEYTGRVVVAGQALQSLTEAALAEYRARITGVVFQGLGILEHLNVRENVMLPAAFRRAGCDAGPASAEDLLERVGLVGRGDERPTDFSGGERQRLMLARALFGGPSILLCDEMTGQLDDETAAGMLDLLARARRDLGLTVVAVTHNQSLERQADRVVHLSEGVLTSGEVRA